jgi:hypothetical protein
MVALTQALNGITMRRMRLKKVVEKLKQMLLNRTAYTGCPISIPLNIPSNPNPSKTNPVNSDKIIDPFMDSFQVSSAFSEV